MNAAVVFVQVLGSGESTKTEMNRYVLESRNDES